MILPGHLAAPILASRYVEMDRRLALVAGLAPDILDKSLFYVLHVSHWTRIPGHSPLFLAGSTLAVALLGRAMQRDWRWGKAWAIGYGLHLLCDLMPGEGILPWLWPWNSYAHMVSSSKPWFLGGGPVPWLTLTAEATLVALAIFSELAQRRSQRLSAQGRPE